MSQTYRHRYAATPLERNAEVLLCGYYRPAIAERHVSRDTYMRNARHAAFRRAVLATAFRAHTALPPPRHDVIRRAVEQIFIENEMLPIAETRSPSAVDRVAHRYATAIVFARYVFQTAAA